MDRDFAIDPRLLNLGTTISSLKRPGGAIPLPENDVIDYENFTRDETPPIATSVLNSGLLGAGSDTLAKFSASLGHPETHGAAFNKFDTLFRDLDSSEDGAKLEGHAVGHLALWIAQNKSIVPSKMQLEGLGIVTAVPIEKLSTWLRWHGKSLLARAEAVTTYPNMPRFSVEDDPYRARCVLESGFRHRLRKSDSNGRKPFGCTNKCGQSFKRKGDWCRHEKLNFEEWVCPHCPNKILSRHEHLQKHFRDANPAVPDQSKQQSRHFLAAQERPCGFCGTTSASWNAWLFHVARHFEGSPKGITKDISDWVEFRVLGKDKAIDLARHMSNHDPCLAPQWLTPEPLDIELDGDDNACGSLRTIWPRTLEQRYDKPDRDKQEEIHGDFSDKAEDEYDSRGFMARAAPHLSKSSIRSTPRVNERSATIASLPSTAPKYHGDTPEPDRAQQLRPSSGLWRPGKNLPPSPSQATLRPTRPNCTFLARSLDRRDMQSTPSSHSKMVGGDSATVFCQVDEEGSDVEYTTVSRRSHPTTLSDDDIDAAESSRTGKVTTRHSAQHSASLLRAQHILSMERMRDPLPAHYRSESRSMSIGHIGRVQSNNTVLPSMVHVPRVAEPVQTNDSCLDHDDSHSNTNDDMDSLVDSIIGHRITERYATDTSANRQLTGREDGRDRHTTRHNDDRPKARDTTRRAFLRRLLGGARHS